MRQVDLDDCVILILSVIAEFLLILMILTAYAAYLEDDTGLGLCNLVLSIVALAAWTWLLIFRIGEIVR